jgi:transposase-like protein
MRVMSDVTDPDQRKHTMTEGKRKGEGSGVKALLAGDDVFIRSVVRAGLQEVLEVEMTEALGAGKGERTPARLGDRSGYYGRTLITRVGNPRDAVPGGQGATGSGRPLFEGAI